MDVMLVTGFFHPRYSDLEVDKRSIVERMKSKGPLLNPWGTPRLMDWRLELAV
ncbi:hypothetical protein J6590_039079 [Homalodisca vitripennis]|nr:hypothetical protein J6590_039079 [Homalodisca vitripennis]